MLDAARLILYNAVRMFKNSPNEAMIAAHEAKWMAKETLEKVIWSARKSAARRRYSSNIRWNVFTATCTCT